ncbi:hypothetical protein IFM89_019802 [Coptis chinensis]|uniref:Cytochrome P450 n=1 Tax=Coptis chinensis TaxID=261450 RepID=A0A835ID37_9MAGN|nr:hypothetical protein IFM89_019802 [Coptis chinensis]
MTVCDVDEVEVWECSVGTGWNPRDRDLNRLEPSASSPGSSSSAFQVSSKHDGHPWYSWGTLDIMLLLLATNMKKASVGANQLPPGPPGWPVFGNIFDLGAMPHISLSSLSKKYGPVVWLRLGTVNTMLLSSAEAATEMFKNHDLTFSGRNISEAMRACSYNQGSMALGQHGPYWRMLRRICTTELFTNNRINETEQLRTKCIDNMLRWMWDESKKTGSIELAWFVSLMSFNVVGNVMLSEDLVDPQSKEGDEFFKSISRTIEWGGKPNVADFFPFLQWLDPQRIKKNMTRDMGHSLDFASRFVKQRILDRQSKKNSTKVDFLDVMLDFQGNQKDGEPADISEKNINIMILELFTASTDTTTSTIEWAMTELLRNPGVMKKVQEELHQVVGQNKCIEESKIGDLHYLQAILKETLRLHPPVPLLVPHRAMEDTKFMSYSIPKDTQILVNVWAIGRDPVSWDDPLSFKPERFFRSNTDYKGHHFQFIPFGAGRRMCVGLPLAHRMLHLALGSLIHSFEWALEDGITPEMMDMRERLGITLRKADPLKVVLKLRLVQENHDTVN